MTSEQGNANGGQVTQRKRRWPWIVGGVAVIVVIVFVILLAVIVAQLAGSGGGSSSASANYTEDYVSGEGSDKVAVIPVDGTIAPDVSSAVDALPTTTPRGLEEALEQAGNDGDVKAVILEVNSPGGGVTASAEMHSAIEDFKKKTGEPVIVSMADTAASGGYYISTAADEIVAQPTTLTGSLGVYIGLLNFNEAADKYGVTQNYVKSGEFKTMGDPWRKLTPGERDIFQSIVDENYDQFVDVIVDGRDLSESRVREIADGRVYSGEQGRELGLVDELGDLDTAAGVARNRADLDQATVVRYVQEPGLASLLSAKLSPSPPKSEQVMKALGVENAGSPQYLYIPGAMGDSVKAPR